MNIITIRLPEKLLDDLNTYAQAIHVPRAEYIRRAIEQMNNEVKNKERSEHLKKLSLRVRKESMVVNKEFNRIENDPENKD